MYPLHIKNKSHEYELKLQNGRSWQRPLFILLAGYLLAITASLLFVFSTLDLFAGISGLAAISADVAAFILLVYRDRTQGRLFFVQCLFLLVILLTFTWLEGLPSPLIWLGSGSLLFLSLWLVTCISAAIADKKTSKSIDAFSLALSEERVTVGIPITISYQLTCKQAIQIKTLRITFVYQQYTGQESSGQDAYAVRSMPLHQKDNLAGDPEHPIIEEFQFTIPEDLNVLWRERRDWSLDVSIKPNRGSSLFLPKPSAEDAGVRRVIYEEHIVDEEWLAMGTEVSQPAADEEEQQTADEA
jgi:hypothetical protein